jgi:hypothetical protein
VLSKDQNQVVVSDEFIAQRMREDAEREAELGIQPRQGTVLDWKEQRQPEQEKPDPIVEEVAELQTAIEGIAG